jgi:hypothetical protein
MSGIKESAISAKRQAIKSNGEIVYDGDPRKYEWKAKSIQKLFNGVEEVLSSKSRRFERLLITKKPPERWFLATSTGSPEVVYYFYYNSGGMQTYVYIDHLRYKTQEFLDLPAAEKAKLISTVITPNPAEIWRRERSVDLIGSALESLGSKDADAAIKSLGPKLLNAISKMPIDSANLNKLARFINSLVKINTADSNKLAQASMESFKNGAIKSMLADIKDRGSISPMIMMKVEFLKKHFHWPELDVIKKSSGPRDRIR